MTDALAALALICLLLAALAVSQIRKCAGNPDCWRDDDGDLDP